MNPIYSTMKHNTQLHEDDITAIQLLYGRPEENRVFSATQMQIYRPMHTNSPTQPRTFKTPFNTCNGRYSRTNLLRSPARRMVCNIFLFLRFDAITRVHNGSTFAFRGNFYWRIGAMGMDEGYPRSIKQGWEFDGQVDAALTHDGYTDFFQVHFYTSAVQK